MKYTEQAVETLDDAGSVIANKNIEIEQLRQSVAELERSLDSAYQLADHYRDERDALKRQRDDLVNTGSAVVERWDSPLWKDLPHTGEYIHRLREAIASAKEKA